MLTTIIIVLALLWGLGLATSTTLGGFLHLLVVVVFVLLCVRLIIGPARKRRGHARS